ncbi:MAG TPA: 2-dehydropantoate 2-reductase [Opitutaceae bacterium]|nr:2-dehydropantoate 2-reductase [Opitutaceae bacterium]
MARIAIIGPGAVGGIVAAWLHQTGRHEVLVCARRAFQELCVDTPAGVLRSRPTVLDTPVAASPVDWVLVATKAYDAAGASAWFPRLVAPATRVAILQNGVEHCERFATSVAPDQLLPVMVDLPGERSAPGVIRQRAPGRMLAPDGESGRAFVGLFAATIIDAALTADFRTAVWRKLCHNSAGVLNALLLQPAGVFRDEAVADLARAVVRECAAVGRAEGAALPEDIADTVIQAYRAGPADGVNSLHADRAAGRPMELDARNGVIVRLGRRHGIPTPCNQMAVTLLETLARPTA